MARHPMVSGLALTLGFAAQPAFADEEESCEERYDTVASLVTNTLDRAGVPWVSPTRFNPACNCMVPRTRAHPCRPGESSTFSVRRLVRGPQTYVEFQFPRLEEIEAGAELSGIAYRHLSVAAPDPLQEYADPATIVAAGAGIDALWCPPPTPSPDPSCEGACDDTCGGTCSVFSFTGVDAPADVGEAAGSNPLVQDFGGGDDYLGVVTFECSFE